MPGTAICKGETRQVIESAARVASTNSEDIWLVAGGGAIEIILDVTAKGAPAGNISSVIVQQKVGSNYKTLHTFGSLTINDIGQFLFLIQPAAASASGWSAAPIQGSAPEQFRIRLIHDDANSLTYSAAVNHLK